MSGSGNRLRVCGRQGRPAASECTMLRSAAANWKANKQILPLVTQLQPIASKSDNNPRVTSAHHTKSTFIEGNNIHRAFDDILQKGKSLTKQKYNATLPIARACQLPIRVYIQVLVRHGSIEAETHPTVPQHFRSIRLPIFAFSRPNVNNSGVGRYFSNSFSSIFLRDRVRCAS